MISIQGLYFKLNRVYQVKFVRCILKCYRIHIIETFLKNFFKCLHKGANLQTIDAVFRFGSKFEILKSCWVGVGGNHYSHSAYPAVWDKMLKKKK